MSHDLQRFLDAQNDLWPDVKRELRAGRKENHWMWFVFPQLAGLGSSAMAQRYAIADAAEARAYLDHAVLGSRLREATGWMLGHPRTPAEEILGPIDALKLRSSATLFGRVAEEPGGFAEILRVFFDGGEDPRTVELLRSRSGIS